MTLPPIPHSDDTAAHEHSAPGALPVVGGDPMPALELLRWAVAAGALTGLAEAIVLGIRKLLFGRFAFVGVDFLWMSPASNAALFAAIGVLLLAVRAVVPPLRTRYVTAMVLLAMGLWSVALHEERLHPAAGGALAVGVAHRLARAARLRAAPRVWTVVASVVCACLAVRGTRELAERRAISVLPTASPDAPHVLLIVMDTVRAKSLSTHGRDRPTSPFLVELAKSSTTFANAWSTSSWTLPSHGTLFTGRYPHQLSANWGQPLDGTHPVLAELLAAQGYRTGAMVANIHYCNGEFGLARGFSHYEDFPVSWNELLYSSVILQRTLHRGEVRRVTGTCGCNPLGHKPAAQINEAFLSWLDRDPSRPFFAFLNYMDAHTPYAPPPPYDRKWASSAMPNAPERWHFWRRFIEYERVLRTTNALPGEMEGLLDAYESGIAYLDEQLRSLFSELDRRGLLERTLVVITADHGEQVGEQGAHGHGLTLCPPETHVPLLLRLPGRIPAGRSVPAPVTLRDVPATILDLSGSPPGLPGHSLSVRWAATPPPPTEADSPILSSLDGWRSIEPGERRAAPGTSLAHHALVFGRYRAIRWENGREQVFDHERDPEAIRDLAGTVDGSAALAEFRRRLGLILGGSEAR